MHYFSAAERSVLLRCCLGSLNTAARLLWEKHLFVVKVKQTKNKQRPKQSFFSFLILRTLSLGRNSDHLTWARLQQPQEQRYPFLQLCEVFSRVQTMVYSCQCWRFLKVRTYVDACDCTRGLYEHRKRDCTESWLWEKNPLPQQRDSNLRLYYAWLSSRTLYQLSFSPPLHSTA